MLPKSSETVRPSIYYILGQLADAGSMAALRKAGEASEMAELIGKKAKVSATKDEVFNSLVGDERIFELDESMPVATSILIKGSRSTAMDELVDMIVKKAAQ
mgnify:CR=1 FL=1